MPNATTIAEEIRWQAADAGVPVTPLKLQKLLFLVQVQHLRDVGDLAFHDPLYAWKLGPVVRAVYDVHKGSLVRLPRPARRPRVPAAVRQAVKAVLADHGAKSASQLVRLTHRRGGAWLATPSGEMIQPETLATKELTAADRKRLGDRRKVFTDDEELLALGRSMERDPPSGETVRVSGDLFAHFGL